MRMRLTWGCVDYGGLAQTADNNNNTTTTVVHGLVKDDGVCICGTHTHTPPRETLEPGDIVCDIWSCFIIVPSRTALAPTIISLQFVVSSFQSRWRYRICTKNVFVCFLCVRNSNCSQLTLSINLKFHNNNPFCIESINHLLLNNSCFENFQQQQLFCRAH